MMPGRLSCIHCKTSFTMPFALTNHFDKGTCPQLVLNWVGDTHYGPPVDSSHTPDGTPAMQMNQVQHYSCGLILGSTATSRHCSTIDIPSRSKTPVVRIYSNLDDQLPSSAAGSTVLDSDLRHYGTGYQPDTMQMGLDLNQS